VSSQPEAGRVVIRRRCSSRHRRHRRTRRALLITLCALTVLSVSSVLLQRLSPSLFRAGSHIAEANTSEQAAQKTLDLFQQEAAREMARHPIYPYSVISGGVRSGHELKAAAGQDPVVALHYAGFDYAHARLVQLLTERSVYLSYRIGNRVYWTRHRVKLHKGETVLTDGKMTARTRCANRVEEAPQQESSNMEPPAARFDEPLMPAIGTGLATAPGPFRTSLERASVAPPLSMYDPIAGGSWTPFAPPPLPNVCGITPTKKPGTKGTAIASSATAHTGKGKNKNVDVCGGGSTSEVPEPGTWVLMITGMAGLLWMAGHRLSAATLVRHS
jgi:hypothetical protein